MSESPLRVLVVEDNRGDRVLLHANMAPAGERIVVTEAATLAEAVAAVQGGAVFDAALLDLGLPDSQGLATLSAFRTAAPRLPTVVLTGLDDDQAGTAAVRAGAQDYLVKGNIESMLLLRALHYAVERSKLLAQLQDALAQVKTLSGLLPICASCKKIRNKQGEWQQIESYVRQRTDAEFTHGICPECAKQFFPGVTGAS
ncbi:MAG: response regulator [Candidatus Methylomirabilia bacterium]